ncbi:MAG TPA: YheC/YheD family protein [Bacillales bacterium]|nr:YheC/YheD family protein [Bacillales bacterium]
MPSFGIITLNQNQEERYFKNIGEYAAKLDLKVHQFVPNAIDPYTEQITGKTFDPGSGTWKAETFTIPDVLYDRCFYTSSQAYKTNAPIVEWLKNRTLFLGFGLPNKSKVYQALQSEPYLNSYTIDTLRARKADFIIEELEKQRTLLLKPENGSQGKGILVLRKQPENFTVKTDRRGKTVQKTFLRKSQLKKWLDTQLVQTPFLIQPFLSLQNENQQPFDIRIVVQKNADGKWIERGRGVRIGKAGAIVSNLHSTGKIADFSQWLKTFSNTKRSFLEHEIASIIERVPPLLESSFGPLFELGLDIGIDQEDAVWVLEANSKPGHQTILQSGELNEKEIAQAPLQYARYLLKQKELKDNESVVETAKN